MHREGLRVNSRPASLGTYISSEQILRFDSIVSEHGEQIFFLKVLSLLPLDSFVCEQILPFNSIVSKQILPFDSNFSKQILPLDSIVRHNIRSPAVSF